MTELTKPPLTGQEGLCPEVVSAGEAGHGSSRARFALLRPREQHPLEIDIISLAGPQLEASGPVGREGWPCRDRCRIGTRSLGSAYLRHTGQRGASWGCRGGSVVDMVTRGPRLTMLLEIDPACCELICQCDEDDPVRRAERIAVNTDPGETAPTVVEAGKGAEG